MYMPKNFVLVLYGISLPSDITCGNTGFLFCMVWKDIANVFSTLTTKLFSVNHVSNSVITLLVYTGGCLYFHLVVICLCHLQITLFWIP